MIGIDPLNDRQQDGCENRGRLAPPDPAASALDRLFEWAVRVGEKLLRCRTFGWGEGPGHRAQRVTAQHIAFDRRGESPRSGQIGRCHAAARLDGIGFGRVPGHEADESLRLGRVGAGYTLGDQAPQIVDRPFVAALGNQCLGLPQIEPGQVANRPARRVQPRVGRVECFRRGECFVDQAPCCFAAVDVEQTRATSIRK